MEKQFEVYVDQELTRLKDRTAIFNQFKLLLNSTQLKDSSLNSSVNFELGHSKNIRKPISMPNSYQKKSPNTQKIRFVLNELGRASTESEILEAIREYEPKISASKLDSVVRAFRTLAHPVTGELIYFNYRNSKHRFYIKNEWLSDDKTTVQLEYAPPVDIIDDILPNEIQPENIIWHESK